MNVLTDNAGVTPPAKYMREKAHLTPLLIDWTIYYILAQVNQEKRCEKSAYIGGL